jgi:hypothetical protein
MGQKHRYVTKKLEQFLSVAKVTLQGNILFLLLMKWHISFNRKQKFLPINISSTLTKGLNEFLPIHISSTLTKGLYELQQ